MLRLFPRFGENDAPAAGDASRFIVHGRLRASVEARLIYDPKRNYGRRWTMIYRSRNKLRATTPCAGKSRESFAE